LDNPVQLQLMAAAVDSADLSLTIARYEAAVHDPSTYATSNNFHCKTHTLLARTCDIPPNMVVPQIHFLFDSGLARGSGLQSLTGK
jgi:hypothetical protein